MLSTKLKAAAGNSADATLYVDDVFSTYLYTGNGTTQTITNGIDLAGKGGLVWIKSRSAATNNFLFDTSRGVNVEINSNTTDANITLANSVTAFNSSGFAVGSAAGINVNAATYASWTFRKAAKFFDVVTYTGNNTASITVAKAHNLGAVPGLIIVKRTDAGTAGEWYVYHQSLGATKYLILNGTQAAATYSGTWGDTTPTATNFYVQGSETNANGGSFVAYLFATLAGISKVGSYTGNGTGQAIACGFSAGARFVLIKRTDAAGAWYTFDSARGLTSGSSPYLLLNSNAAEVTGNNGVYASTGGFTLGSTASTTTNINAATYIFLAVA